MLEYLNWPLRSKLQWNFNQNYNIFIQEYAFESVVSETAAILPGAQCVNIDSIWLRFSKFSPLQPFVIIVIDRCTFLAFNDHAYPTFTKRAHAWINYYAEATILTRTLKENHLQSYQFFCCYWIVCLSWWSVVGGKIKIAWPLTGHNLNHWWTSPSTRICVTRSEWTNSSSPERNDRHLADDIFKSIFMNKKLDIDSTFIEACS